MPRLRWLSHYGNAFVLWRPERATRASRRSRRGVRLGRHLSSPQCTSDGTEMESIGAPVPGCEIKLLPNHDRLELRVLGPNVSLGYWRRDDLTREAFDDEGFLRMAMLANWL